MQRHANVALVLPLAKNGNDLIRALSVKFIFWGGEKAAGTQCLWVQPVLERKLNSIKIFIAVVSLFILLLLFLEKSEIWGGTSFKLRGPSLGCTVLVLEGHCPAHPLNLAIKKWNESDVFEQVSLVDTSYPGLELCTPGLSPVAHC